mmetsp:Transcript_20006/g.79799  ORF Transcript_20006/g.79799 Transcript_20006/m.79799 type:complete len:234 (+) Transcript_20006:395-1096(+)
MGVRLHAAWPGTHRPRALERLRRRHLEDEGGRVPRRHVQHTPDRVAVSARDEPAHPRQVPGLLEAHGRRHRARAARREDHCVGQAGPSVGLGQPGARHAPRPGPRGQPHRAPRGPAHRHASGLRVHRLRRGLVERRLHPYARTQREDHSVHGRNDCGENRQALRVPLRRRQVRQEADGQERRNDLPRRRRAAWPVNSRASSGWPGQTARNYTCPRPSTNCSPAENVKETMMTW